jgi:hypothetical protein
MQLPQNPFTFNPVGRDLFTGRKDELALVYHVSHEAMKSSRSRIIVVTGPRGIGKTSFLDLIRGGNISAASDDVVDLAVFEPVFSKLEKITSRELHDVIDIGVVKLLGGYHKRYKLLYGMKRFFRAFEGGIFGTMIKFSDNVSMEDLLRRLRSASGAIVKLQRPAVLTILLDEMDPHLKVAEGLPDFIRSCAEHVLCPLVFLLAGLPPAWNSLREAHPSIPRTADHIQLKPLQRNEVDQLMQTAVGLANRTAAVRIALAPGASDLIFELTGGHPSLVQILGYRSVEKLLQNLKDEPEPKPTQTSITKDVIAHAQRLADLGTRVFDGWVHDLADTEKRVLWQIASLQKGQHQIDATQIQPTATSRAQVLDALKMLRDEWGLLDLNNQIISRAFLTWLKSTPIKSPAEST